MSAVDASSSRAAERAAPGRPASTRKTQPDVGPTSGLSLRDSDMVTLRRVTVAPLAAMGLRAGRRVRPQLLAAAFLAGLALASFLCWRHNDLDLFRWPMAQLVLHGHPLLVYSVHAGVWWSDNGPLSLLPLTAVAATVNALGWQADAPLRDAVVMGVFGIFALGLASEAAQAVASVRGRPLPRPVAIWSALLLSPPLWIGMVSYGHAELPLQLWLILLTVRQLGRDRMALAGCLLGLALLTQTAVLLAALPLVLILIARRRLGAVTVLLGTAAAVTAAGLLPFLLADGRDVVTSLVTYRAQVPAFGGSLLTVAAGTPVAAFVQHNDALLFGALAVVVTWIGLRDVRTPALGSPRVYALMALSTACLPLLAKSVGRTTWSIPARSRPSGGWPGRGAWRTGGCAFRFFSHSPPPLWSPAPPPCASRC